MKKRFYLTLTTSVLLVVVGVGLLLYPKITDWSYALFQKSLEALAEGDQADSDGLEDDVSIPDGAVGKISIPEIDLEAYVVPGTSRADLKKGPGHYEDTPFPGEAGNCAIAGHRTMYGHPFRHLDELNQGDKIAIYTSSGKHLYRVTGKKAVRPTDVSVIDPTEEATLTLTTCHPVGSDRQRLVVVAQIQE